MKIALTPVATARTLENRSPALVLDGILHVTTSSVSTYDEATTLCGLTLPADTHDSTKHLPLGDVDCLRCAALALATPFLHSVSTGRVRAGVGPLKGGRTRYATTWHCTCHASGRVNLAPSAGGRQMAEEAAAEHLALMTEQNQQQHSEVAAVDTMFAGAVTIAQAGFAEDEFRAWQLRQLIADAPPPVQLEQPPAMRWVIDQFTTDPCQAPNGNYAISLNYLLDRYALAHGDRLQPKQVRFLLLGVHAGMAAEELWACVHGASWPPEDTLLTLGALRDPVVAAALAAASTSGQPA